MSQAERTVVIFKSDVFNTSKPKDYFINPCCFGDDVAKWLLVRLRSAGCWADDNPGQEDFGWFLLFAVDGVKHCFVIGYRPSEDQDGEWIGWVERNTGLTGWINWCP